LARLAPQYLLLAALGRIAFALAIQAFWGVLIPVVIVEGHGLGASLARAWRLLSGNRWRFVALFALISVIEILPRIIAEALLFPMATALRLQVRPETYLRFVLEVAGALGALVTAVWCVMIAVAYLELRRGREGVAAEDVADIFA
jgi:hypothetical protein